MSAGPGVPRWFEIAREIHAIGQAGLYYSQNEFDRDRFERLVQMAAQMISEHAESPIEDIHAALGSQPGYVTPKVDVRGAIFSEDRVLMVKEVTDGKWSLPGGWADVNVPLSRMIEREVLEETGLTVAARKLVGVYEANHDREPIPVFHSYKLLFLCDSLAGTLQTSYETPEVAYFPLDGLPELSTNRTRENYIIEAYRHLQHPELPSIFD